MSPLNLVGMLFLICASSVQSYRTDFGADDSLNTISSTPFPAFGQSSSFSSSKSFASSYASSGAYSSSHSSSGYDSGLPKVSVNDAGTTGYTAGSGAFASAGAGANAFSASATNPGAFGYSGSKIAESVNGGLGNPFAGSASYSSSGSFSSAGSASASNSYSSSSNSQIGADGKISGGLSNGYTGLSGGKHVGNAGLGGGYSSGSYSSSGIAGSTGSATDAAHLSTGSTTGGNLGAGYSGIKTTSSGLNSAFGSEQTGSTSGAFSTSGSLSGSGSTSYNAQGGSEIGDRIRGNLGGNYGATNNGAYVANGVSDAGIYKPIKTSGGKVQFQTTASTVNIKNNPFLTGQIRPVAPEHIPKPIVVADSSSSASSFGAGNRASVDISHNPFLTGSVPAPPAKPVGCNSINGGSCSGSSSPPLAVNGACNGGVGSVCGSKPTPAPSGSGSSLSLNNNPFLGGNYQPQPAPQKPEKKPADLSGNPFLVGGNKGPTYQPTQPQGFPTPYPQQPSVISQQPQPFPSQIPQQPQPFPSQIPQQPFPSTIPQQPQPFPSSIPQQPQPFPSQKPQGFPTTVPQGTYTPAKNSVIIDGATAASNNAEQCGSSGYICVPKEQCVNGVVTAYGEGLLQARTSLQYCKAESEVCCQLGKPAYPTPSILAPSSPPVYSEFQKTTSSNFQQSNSFSGSTASQSTSKLFTNNANQLTQSTIGSPSYTQGNLGPLIPGAYSSSGIIHSSPGENPFRNVNDLKGPAYLPPIGSPSTPQYTTTPPEYLPPKITTTTTTTTTTTPRPTTQPPTYLPPRATDSSIIYLKTTLPTTTTTTVSPNAYLPPYEGEGSSIKNKNILPPLEGNPSERDQTIVGLPTSPRPIPTQGIILNTAIPSGCAAALKCVPIEYCTAEGVISNTTVRLTPKQNENRVPLTECLNEETNVRGRCCRDPTYKDPWPVGQLGLWNPDNGFDNGQYTPDKQKPQRINNQLGPQTQPRFPPPSSPNPFASGSILSPTQVRINPASTATCGVRNQNTQPRGNSPIDANFAEIPWQAMVLRESSRKLLCGGVIVRPDTVLTAAHCVEGIPANDIFVKGGEWRLGIDEEPKPFQIVKVASIIIHPQYSPENKFNDVAILLLGERFRFDQHVEAICLPGEDDIIEDSFSAGTCIATGWGKQALSINIQNVLMHRIQMNLLQPDQCQSALSNNHPSSLYQYSPSTCICGQPRIPQNNLCEVDQGSALACDVGNGKYVLSGIYSWDTGCDQGNQIGGFTRLDIRWVLSQLNQQSGTLGNNFRQQQNIYQQKQIPSPYFGVKGSYSQNRPQYQPSPISYNGAEPPCDCQGK